MQLISQTSDFAAFKAALDSDFDPVTNPKSELMKTNILYGTPFFNSSYYLAKLGLSHQDPFHFDYYTQDFITDETDELNQYMTDKFEPFLEKEFNVSPPPLSHCVLTTHAYPPNPLERRSSLHYLLLRRVQPPSRASRKGHCQDRRLDRVRRLLHVVQSRFVLHDGHRHVPDLLLLLRRQPHLPLPVALG